MQVGLEGWNKRGEEPEEKSDQEERKCENCHGSKQGEEHDLEGGRRFGADVLPDGFGMAQLRRWSFVDFGIAA